MATTIKERQLMEKVSKLYYLEGWTQNQICTKVGLSRPIVSKLLKQARKKNIVEIHIKDETVHTVELERLLERQYALTEAIVVSDSDEFPGATRRAMGEAASAYLRNKLPTIQTLGISWGKTIRSMVDRFQGTETPHVHLVPLIGGMGQSHVEYHSNQLAFQLARKLNASSSYVYAPAFADNKAMKAELIKSKDVAAIMEEGKKIDFAIVGIGSVTHDTTGLDMGYLNASDIASLEASGAKGDLNSWFFDADGNEVSHPINDRIVGANLDRIRRIPEVMALAEGEHKVPALHTALRAGLINSLVTDERTAANLVNVFGDR
ncbi:DNA-binding transcriptional regulator LsrR, DeoR family [Lentibacillus persicus]|uniref:DNA-binding transcriptional regulator LsrR, DeoR family n=1 Tax=Lentibacillus persicus TaxID=640948 RepID=A0A1I1XXM5_9BACI|nr:sugar-binding transcriptional regulator [Lentibacillus persicus]SFE12031.1 DNA-binding transcriptional regulator LsrR, DeoR family [Lentibacillus persicus]